MNRLRQNKHFVTVVCLILGAVLLCSAAVANIGNAGGYEAYKKGLFGLIGMKDYSGSGYVELNADGVELVRIDYTEQVNSSAGVGESMTHTKGITHSDFLLEDFSASTVETWAVVNPEDHITEKKYTVYSYSPAEDAWLIDSGSYSNTLFGNLVDAIDLSNRQNAKIMRVAELALDAFVGDLKNNFVYVGREDGLRSYRISLSGDQLPEIVQTVISLMFDSENDQLFYGGAYVRDAVDFDGSLVDNEAYQQARSDAWTLVMETHERCGVAVINNDLSIDWYPSTQDYYATLGPISITDIFEDGSLEWLFFAIKGEPKILNCSCDLAINDSGELMRNTLVGRVGFELIDGSWHELELKIHGEFDSRGESISIPLPDVDPNAAYILDQSLACEKNDYEYTVSSLGRVEVYHLKMEMSAPEGSLDEFLGRPAFYKLSGAAANEIYIRPSGIDHSGTEVVYVDGEGRWVPRDEFDDMCEYMLGNEEVMRTAASGLDISPEMLKLELLCAYAELTGERYEDTGRELAVVAGDSEAVDPIISYCFYYTPIDRIIDAGVVCSGGMALRYSDADIPEGEQILALRTRHWSGDDNRGYDTLYFTASELADAISAISNSFKESDGRLFAADAAKLFDLNDRAIYTLVETAYDLILQENMDNYLPSSGSLPIIDSADLPPSNILSAIGGADGPSVITVSGPIG